MSSWIRIGLIAVVAVMLVKMIASKVPQLSTLANLL